jgi:hypothetical protein
MTPIITAFDRSPGRPIAAGDWRVTRAFAGRLKKWVSLTKFVFFLSLR